MASDARLRANAKWDAENTEKLSIKLNTAKDPTRAEIQAAADRDGISMSRWVIEAIREKLGRG